ncbi:MAG: ferric reductase-like transmembrane domain-containing protein [Myxococcota bacterium]|nr:ferric reductase-like transmembrane domain-containing protein [Myxococcota bacterium]
MPARRGLVLLLALLLLAMSAAVLASTGTGEEGVRALIRATARSSVLLLCLAFAARPLRQLWRSELSGWMLRARRSLGLGYALCQALHLAAILVVVSVHAGESDLVTWIGGGVGYVFTAAMALTSTDAWVKRLTRKRWTLLHRTGMYVNVGIMAFTFQGGVSEAAEPAPYWLALAAIALASGIRLAAWLRSRR